ncbi:MAG: TIM44-like domain-containing protein [Bacilli bacterium]|nr:TIM44-like domain-containing protein [Bacilli bacterium]
MNKKILMLIITVFSSFIICTNVDAKVNEVNIYLFYGETCPHCEKEQKYLESLQKEYTNIKIYKYEVWNNTSNKNLMYSIKKELGTVEDERVPFTVIGDYGFIGYSDSKNSIFEEKIDFYSRNTYTNKAGSLLGISYNVLDQEPKEIPTKSATTKKETEQKLTSKQQNIKETLIDFKDNVIENVNSFIKLIKENILMSIVIIACTITLIASLIIRIIEINLTNKKVRNLKRRNKNFDVNKIYNLMADFDEGLYKEYLFDTFIEVQKAVEEFELESIKDIVTESMYVLLEDNINRLKENNQRIVMEDIEYKDMIFTNAYIDNNDLILECQLRFIAKNYVANRDTNDVVKGLQKDTRFDYKLIFIKYNHANSIEKMPRCPSCDAPLEKNDRDCPYCGKKLYNKNNFLLSKQIYIKKKVLE